MLVIIRDVLYQLLGSVLGLFQHILKVSAKINEMFIL